MVIIYHFCTSGLIFAATNKTTPMTEINRAIESLQGNWRSEDGSYRFEIQGSHILNITGPLVGVATAADYNLSYDLETDSLEIWSVPVFNAWPGALMMHHDGNSFQVIPMGNTVTGSDDPRDIPRTTRYFRIGED